MKKQVVNLFNKSVSEIDIPDSVFGIKVFPDSNTAWHFDDKVGQKYLLEASPHYFNNGKSIATHIKNDIRNLELIFCFRNPVDHLFSLYKGSLRNMRITKNTAILEGSNFIGFTKSVALELGSRNIRCNAIAPGFIETEMTAVLDEKTVQQWRDGIPLKRGGSAEDVANACLFLASDMSGYITGQVMNVCGGMLT